MNKPILVSFVLSSTLVFGAVGGLYLLRASDSPGKDPAPDSVSVDPSALVVTPPGPPPAAYPAVVQLQELRIVARPRPRQSVRTAPAQAPVQLAERELIACSDWRELGPVYSVREGEVPRQRRVQMLCMAP